MKRTVKYVWCLAALAGLWIPVPATAQSCSTLLSDINSWFINEPDGPGTYSIDFTMVSNRTDGQYATYSEGSGGQKGTLNYHPAHNIFGISVPPYLQGSMEEYFSNARYDPSPGPGFEDAWAPFDPKRTNRLGVTIYLESAPPPFSNQFKLGEVALTLDSWGGGNFFFPGLCTDGMLYGFLALPPTNVPNLFVMSLNKRFDNTILK